MRENKTGNLEGFEVTRQGGCGINSLMFEDTTAIWEKGISHLQLGVRGNLCHLV